MVLNEEQAIKIIETEPIKITESEILKDIHMSKEERIKHAKEILERWDLNFKE